MERQERARKDRGSEEARSPQNSSFDSARNIQPLSRSSTLGDVPEDSAFAIGDDDDSDMEQEGQVTPGGVSSPTDSRAPSISSSVDDAVPLQLRGMSEKARGKMPAGAPSFSRQNSTTSLSSHLATTSAPQIGFQPSSSWVSSYLISSRKYLTSY
jgi:High-temperature-induced dauer-formation protein